MAESSFREQAMLGKGGQPQVSLSQTEQNSSTPVRFIYTGDVDNAAPLYQN